MRIGILKCDSRDPAFPSRFGGQEDRTISLLETVDSEIKLFVFDVADGDYPFTSDFCDGYVCLGSQASVNDDDPWIGRLEEFVRELHRDRIPLVGICFGHQMMGKALGGECRRGSSGESGLGVLPLEVSREETWMSPEMLRCHLLHYHHEQVTRLPEGAVVLGSSPHCPNALVLFDQPFLGIQAHPEMTAGFAAELLQSRGDSLEPEELDEALASLAKAQDGPVIGRWIVRFLESHRQAGRRVRPGL